MNIDWSIVDKVIYINLKEHKERCKSIETELKEVGVSENKLYRFEAISHPVGYIGCAMSHAKILELAIINNWGNVLIFEDDMLISKDVNTLERINRFFSTLKQVSWNVAFLAANYHRVSVLKSAPEMVRVWNARCCGAYLVNANYVPILYQNFSQSVARLKQGGFSGHFACDVYWTHLSEQHTWLGMYPVAAHPKSAVCDSTDYKKSSINLLNLSPSTSDEKDFPEISDKITGLKNSLIPKLIHIIWIGDESKRPDAFIKTWKEKNPDWTVKVWGNKELRQTYWYNQKHINERLNAGEYTAVSDMMRYEIMFYHGGFYVDADTVCVAPLESWLFDSQVCMSMENELTRSGLVANTYIAAEPKSVLMAELMMAIKARLSVSDEQAWIATGPKLVTDTIHRLKYNNLTLWPSHYFIPDHFTGETYMGTGHTFAKHIWGTTRGVSHKLAEFVPGDSPERESLHV
ncbi:glycosyltransferase [Klebsiella aerogenes]|uniref:glycosyltransferase n=1 Tax=Klebsiella aerogenes TaxID=548 RepID=UPI003CFCF506